MRSRIRVSLLVGLILFLVPLGCRRAWFVDRGPSPIKKVEGESYYTQVGMWIEGREHETTNYARGWFLPVNSEVKILSTTASTIQVWAEKPSKTFTIVNVREYTRRGIKDIFQRYFDTTKVDLSGFSDTVRDHIRDGELHKGMSKKAALLARGYPPAHRTASTEVDEWIYWTSRFDKMKVLFDDGNISRIRD